MFDTSIYRYIYRQTYTYIWATHQPVGPQLIRFSQATNMPSPQESCYMQATYKSKASLSTNQNISQPRQAIVSRNMNPIQNRTSDDTSAMRSTIKSGLLLVINAVLKGVISTVRMLAMKLVPSVLRVINQEIPRTYMI